MAKTQLGIAIRALFRLSNSRKVELSCIGCGCTDRRACPGDCSWSEPGLCSRCAPDAEELIGPSDLVNELVETSAVNARLLGRSTFRVPSLALVAWLGDFAATHRQRSLEGYRMPPMTSVRLGRTTWSFALRYRVSRPNQDLVMKFTYFYSLSTGVRRKRKA